MLRILFGMFLPQSRVDIGILSFLDGGKNVLHTDSAGDVDQNRLFLEQCSGELVAGTILMSISTCLDKISNDLLV